MAVTGSRTVLPHPRQGTHRARWREYLSATLTGLTPQRLFPGRLPANAAEKMH
ncbi:hypothetical protein SODG_002056 [Sodalis praecaptivus]